MLSNSSSSSRYPLPNIMSSQTLIERLESLLSNFHSPPKAKKAKRGCVRFSDPPPDDSDITGDHVISTIEQADDHVTNPLTSEDERWVILRSWVSPVMLCLCGECIVKVCQWEGLSQLLLKLLKLYSADSAFSSQLLRYVHLFMCDLK